MASRPLVLAHRGACRRAPENTIEAFRIAGELGADGVELDVRRTRDGVLVVSHDPVVEGFGLLVEHPFEALRAAVPRVPSLEEAFAALDGLIVNVEIKCFPTEPDADPERVVVRGVVALLDELARHERSVHERSVHERLVHERVIVSSFELDAIDAVRALDTRIVTGWLTYGLAPAESLPIAGSRGHAWLNPDRAAMLGSAAVDAVRAAADLGVRIDVWTVDDPDEIRALAGAGVDAIITNLPDVAMAALA
jgi:glycerophosphoryl diester phosphodiesterase